MHKVSKRLSRAINRPQEPKQSGYSGDAQPGRQIRPFHKQPSGQSDASNGAANVRSGEQGRRMKRS